MAYVNDLNNVTALSQLNNYNPKPEQDLLDKTAGVLTAATIDIGTTIWNSLIPESTGFEVSTQDALQKIGYQGAITAYEENREIVDGLSFIGGVFIPGGAALKLTRAIRAGIRGTNWLSQTRHFEDLKKIETLVSEGSEASAAFKKAKASIFLRGQANNAIDVAASEFAIVAALNEHPYMEDYLKDPATNFALSFLIGGTIGGGLAAIGNKMELGKIIGGIQSSTTQEVFDVAKLYTSFAADNTTNALSLKFAADNLEELANKPGVSGLAKQVADNFRINIRAQLGTLETEIFSPEILALTDTVARKSLTDLASDVRFIGVQKISPANIMKPLDTEKGLFARPKVLLSEDATSITRIKDGILYDPKHKAFVPRESAIQLGTIADLNLTLDTVKELSRKKALGLNTAKFRDDVFLNSSANLDHRFASDFFRYNKLVASEVAMTVVEAGDVAKLNGLVFGYRAQVQRLQEVITDPTSADKAIRAATNELDALANSRLAIKEADGTTRHSLLAVLDDDLDAAKTTLIRQLNVNQVPVEVIALKTNTPLEIVEALVNSDAGSLKALGFDDATQFTKYNSTATIEAGLSQQNRILQIQYKNPFSDLTIAEMSATTSEKFLRAKDLNSIMKLQQSAMSEYASAKFSLANPPSLSAEQKALLNNSPELTNPATQRYEAAVTRYEEAMSSAQSDFVDSTLLQFSGLEMADSLRRDVLNNYVLPILRTGISNAVNGKGGNRTWTSTDFATRHMEEFGRLATEIGDARVGSDNRIFKRLITPISASMRSIVSDPAKMTEFAAALNLRASNSGKLLYRDGQFFSQTMRQGQVIDEVPIVVPGTTTPFQVTSAEVDGLLTQLQTAGREIYENQRVVNTLKGAREPSDIGFWVPSFNPVNKHIGYVQDLNSGALRMFVGNTADELTETMQAYPKKAHERLMTRDEVEKFKISVHGDLLDDVANPDASKVKQGIGLVAPEVSPQVLQDLVEGIRSRIQYQSSAIIEASMPDVMQKLDLLSAYNQRATATQGSNAFQRAIKTSAAKDTARDIKEIILGESAAKSNPFISGINTTTNTLLQYGIDMTTKLFKTFRDSAGPATTLDYDKYTASLRAAGIDNPFKVFDDAAQAAQYAKAQGKTEAITPQRLVNTSNAFAATIALRFGELAQPLVNMMSLPILQISAISRTFKAENITSSADVLANGPLAIMLNGVRRMNSTDPTNRKYLKIFEAEGLLNSRVSEVDDLIREARFATGGSVSRIEKIIDSRFVNFMSKPSDMSDMLTRKMTLMTAVELANKIYGPTISDQQMLIFARDFLKQTIGNYSAAQRPAVFQGTFGAAMGLFQTYMLTYAQSMYRTLELQDYKGLGKMMLAQGGIFGAGSLPGFQPVSELIGEEFSDDHMDLVRGTYRALPDPLANILMYGLPSNLAPALHTRGDVNPRVPTGFSTMVAPSMIGQTMDTMLKAGSAILSGNKPAGQAFMEALSMQSVSRPIARWSELLSGSAVTQQGTQIAGAQATGSIPGAINYFSGNAETWNWQGAVARIFSTRPLAEAKIREAHYLKSVYDAADSDNKKAVVSSLNQLIRAGSLDEASLDDLAVEYLRTGSPQGFRSAVHEAMMSNSRDSYLDLTSRLGDSPLMYMLEDIE